MLFKTDFQKNKDWNSAVSFAFFNSSMFKTDFQKNKDWNPDLHFPVSSLSPV